MKKRLFAVLFAVMMLCSIMSINAVATSGTVTVYFTCNQFSPGGYNFNEDVTLESYIPSTYIGSNPPASTSAFASDLFPVVVNLDNINSTNIDDIREVYDPDGYCTGNTNILDVIVYALISQSRTPYGGWDSYNGGGAVYGFGSDGYTTYEDPTIEVHNGRNYYLYEGTNWQIAYTPAGSNTLTAASSYGSSILASNGMVIVFDLSDYTMYYPAF